MSEFHFLRPWALALIMPALLLWLASRRAFLYQRSSPGSCGLAAERRQSGRDPSNLIRLAPVEGRRRQWQTYPLAPS